MKTLPDISPNLNLNDQSKVDDSIKQEGVTINANNGSVVNANSGNGSRGLTRKASMLLVMLFSILGDIMIGTTLYVGQQKMMKQIEEFDIQMGEVFDRSVGTTNQI